jgi:hypothetical protein
MYQNFIIPYLYEAQHVLGNTQPIIRSLKLHWQPLVFHTWKAVGCVVGGCCQAHTVHDNIHQLHVQQPSMYQKPDAQYVPDNIHQLHVQQPSRMKNQRLPVQF